MIAGDTTVTTALALAPNAVEMPAVGSWCCALAAVTLATVASTAMQLSSLLGLKSLNVPIFTLVDSRRTGSFARTVID